MSEWEHDTLSLKNGGWNNKWKYLHENGWRITDQGNWINMTGRCSFICHPAVAWRVQRMRDHRKMKKCTILKWWRKMVKRIKR